MGPKNIDIVPWLFKPFEPIINKMSIVVEHFHLFNGMYWIPTIVFTSCMVRFFLLPIFYFHSKRIAKVANKVGIVKLMGHIYKSCKLTRKEKGGKILRLGFRSSRILKLKPFNIALYYMFLFPFISSTVFGLRKVMG